jgi:hypothetical protein
VPKKGESPEKGECLMRVSLDRGSPDKGGVVQAMGNSPDKKGRLRKEAENIALSERVFVPIVLKHSSDGDIEVAPYII